MVYVDDPAPTNLLNSELTLTSSVDYAQLQELLRAQAEHPPDHEQTEQ